MRHNQNLGDLLVRLRGKKTSLPPITYSAEYRLASGKTLIQSDTLEVPDGLISWHMISKSGMAPRVTTYWASIDDFVRDGESWRARIGGSLEPNHGFVGRIHAKPDPFWKRHPLGTVLLTTAAIVTALQGLNDRFDALVTALFAKPALLVRKETNALEVIEGEKIVIRPVLVNRIRATHYDITVSAQMQPRHAGGLPRAAGQGKIAVEVSEPEIPELLGGEQRELSLVASASSNGHYKLRIRVEGEAGMLRGMKAIESEYDVRIWPLAPVGWAQGKQLAGKRGKLVGEIEIGPEAKEGLDCEILIEKVPRLKYIRLFNLDAAAKNRDWLENVTPGQETYVLSWTVPAHKGSKSLHFELMLEGDENTNWEEVARATKPTCAYRKERL